MTSTDKDEIFGVATASDDEAIAQKLMAKFRSGGTRIPTTCVTPRTWGSLGDEFDVYPPAWDRRSSFLAPFPFRDPPYRIALPPRTLVGLDELDRVVPARPGNTVGMVAPTADETRDDHIMAVVAAHAAFAAYAAARARTRGPCLPPPRTPSSDALRATADRILRHALWDLHPHVEEKQRRQPQSSVPVAVGEVLRLGDEWCGPEGWRPVACALGRKVPPSAETRFRRPARDSLHSLLVRTNYLLRPEDPYVRSRIAQVELGLDEDRPPPHAPTPYTPLIQVQHACAEDL